MKESPSKILKNIVLFVCFSLRDIFFSSYGISILFDYLSDMKQNAIPFDV